MLTSCPACGASNAATRQRCGRCGREMTGEIKAGQAAPVPRVRASRSARREQGSSRRPPGAVLWVPAALVVVLTVGLLNVSDIMPMRWLGSLSNAGNGELAAEHPVLEADDVRASSSREAQGDTTYYAANVLDDDPATSWQEGVAEDGIGEWIELHLTQPGEIAKIIIWNGDQTGEASTTTPRIATAVVDVEDRRFVVDLLDVEGPQAIDLPEPVASDWVRLTIDGVFPGESPHTGLSRVEVRGTPLE